MRVATLALFAVATLAACSATSPEASRFDEPSRDAAADTNPASAIDGVPTGDPARADVATTPDSGATPDAPPDAAALLDALAGRDSEVGRDVASDPDAAVEGGLRDAADADSAVDASDAPPGDSSAPRDSRGDGSVIADAAADPRLCPADGATCDAVNRIAENVRLTFPQPCAVEDERKCGGVVDHALLEAGQYATQTDALMCKNGRWTLAGVWVGTFWSPFFTCSRGCAGYVLCAP
jgi:hypothetical protein